MSTVSYTQRGKMPPSTNRETTPTTEFDNIVIKAISSSSDYNTLKPTRLFLQPQKNQLLQSNAFPLSSGRQVTLTHLAINHNVRFDTVEQLFIFEQYSQLKVNIEDKDYPAMKIADYLPYNRIWISEIDDTVSSGTPTHTANKRMTAIPKMGTYTKLLEPIEVPHNGKIDFQFIPGGDSLKTDTISTYGVKLGAGVVDSDDSPVMLIEFKFMGLLDRPNK